MRRRVGSPTADHRSSSTATVIAGDDQPGDVLGEARQEEGPSPRRGPGTAPRAPRPPSPSRGTRPRSSAPRCRRPTGSARRSRAASSTRATSPAGYTQRNENNRGGSASTTVIGTTLRPRVGRRRPRRARPRSPGATDSRAASSGHHSCRCSGLLMTSNTISGEASTWISRSMLPYSMGLPLPATFGCTSTVVRIAAMRNHWLLQSFPGPRELNSGSCMA